MRAVLVDDHPGFRAAAERLLVAAGFDVAGVAADLGGAWALIDRVDPDLVLLDVQFPDGNGFDLADALAWSAAGRDRTIVMISSRPEADYLSRLRQGTVAGFIRKDELSVERLRTVLGAA